MTVFEVVEAVRPMLREAVRYARKSESTVVEGHDVLAAAVSYEATRWRLEAAGLVVTLPTPPATRGGNRGTGPRGFEVRRSSPSYWHTTIDECILQVAKSATVTPVSAPLLLAECLLRASPDAVADLRSRFEIEISGRPLLEALQHAIRSAS
jgi:hypothetical protein